MLHRLALWVALILAIQVTAIVRHGAVSKMRQRQMYTVPNHEFSVQSSWGGGKEKGDAGLIADLTAKLGQANFEKAREGVVTGVGEPDNMPTPGANAQMAKQFVFGTRGIHWNMLVGRIWAQFIHASPPPMILKNEVPSKKLPAAIKVKNNYRDDLVALVTNKQYRNKLLGEAAKLFLAAVHAPDVKVGATRLGAMFHMLGDSFSASHVIRNIPAGAKAPQSCDKLTIIQAISMDVVNWNNHRAADSVKDDVRFECLRVYVKELSSLWAEVRSAYQALTDEKGKLGVAQTGVTKLLAILCRAFTFDAAALDLPAGGADETYSTAAQNSGWFARWSRLFGGGSAQKMSPSYLASEEDAKAIFAAWNAELKQVYQSAPDKVADHFAYPSRKTADFCVNPSLVLPASISAFSDVGASYIQKELPGIFETFGVGQSRVVADEMAAAESKLSAKEKAQLEKDAANPGLSAHKY